MASSLISLSTKRFEVRFSITKLPSYPITNFLLTEIRNMLHQILQRRLAALLPLLITLGCAVGPNYKRPAVDIPVTYRQPAGDTTPGTAAAPAPSSSSNPAASLGDEKWWELFQDK